MALFGKGFYIWQIARTEGGVPATIANVGAQAGLTHALIKIADGDHGYNINSTTGADLVAPLVNAFRARGIESYGWHYVYGYDPVAEADIAIARIHQTGVAGYIIDAEDEYKAPGRETAARTFMARLRAALPNLPIVLSSYRYPTYHPDLPWQAFLESCDYNMPQVYWVEAHNPGAQLTRCLREFQAITPYRPIIPTGSAYLQGSWMPTPADVTEFLNTARSLNMQAANFWEWYHTRIFLPELWQTISAYDWSGGVSEEDMPDRLIAALNSRSPEAAAALYDANAVHVTNARTIQGSAAILQWYWTLLTTTLPGATFTLGAESGQPGSRRFTWTAASVAHSVNDGEDSLGMVDGKIVYHYTRFTVR